MEASTPGYAFTGVLLVVGTTLCRAVLAMIAFVLSDGQTVPLVQIAIFVALSLAGLGLVVLFVRSIDSRSSASVAPGTEPSQTDRTG